MSSNVLADLFGRASLELRPVSANLELTYKCNLLCSFCYNSPKARKELTGEQWLVALDKMRAAGVFNLALTGGEAMCHRDFWQIAQGVRDRGLVLRLYSNGVLLADRANAERLAELAPMDVEISMHGADAATHERLTGIRGSFEKMLVAFELLQSLGVKVVVKAPITRLNQHQLGEISRIAARYGFRVSFDTNITPTDDGDLSPLSLAADPELVAQFVAQQVRDRERAELKPKQLDKMGANCNTGRTSMTLDPYGDIFPCVAWRRVVANILEVEDLLALWQGRAGQNETLDYVRKAALEIPKKTLKGSPEGAFAAFCPGAAERETGSAYSFYQTAKLSGLVRLKAYEILQSEADPPADSSRAPETKPA
jgi:MoaA/NifB/PqqE/SkfB family radical SAM enzyme